jgi:hypothetical protein
MLKLLKGAKLQNKDLESVYETGEHIFTDVNFLDPLS